EGENKRYVDASTDQVKILHIPQKTIEEGFSKMYGEDTPVKVSILNEYDNYYVNLRSTYTLPVYKVEVGNNDEELYYISPEDGYIKYLNKNKKADKWLFSAIHYLNLPWLISRPWLWTVCIWILCSGCAVVCLSGVVLGMKSLLRKKQ
ncbi:MAG: PepSY domain-containing protein, partial [Bacteroidales bacterium]|nr:PepSY domain-containing protein [Bacteroidales bacterium]